MDKSEWRIGLPPKDEWVIATLEQPSGNRCTALFALYDGEHIPTMSNHGENDPIVKLQNYSNHEWDGHDVIAWKPFVAEEPYKEDC